MQKITVIIITILFLLAGCKSETEQKAEKSSYEDIQKKLSELQTYKSEASVKYISNKNENEYNTLQHCKISGEYRVEVIGPESASGNVTMFDGNVIGQFNPKIGAKLRISQKETKDRSEIFLTSFIKNYFSSDEVSVSASNLEDTKCSVFEAVIPGEHPYLYNEKLWIDNETQMPLKMVIYDPQGMERIIVTYKTFEYNVELEDSLFMVK